MTQRIDPDATEPLAPLVAAPSRMARVDLLPPEITRNHRLRRIAAGSVALLVAYLGALGMLYWLKLGDVDDALAQRDDAQAEVAVLQAEVESLAEYQRLVDSIDTHETLLTTAMGDEVSWARVFGELALSFSRDASLVDVQAVTTGPDAEAQATADPEAVAESPPGAPVGQVTFSGYTVERVAPGVREVLVNFAEAEGFIGSYLVTSVAEGRGDDEVTAFEARVDLNDEVYTHRYDDGLPQESIQ